MLGNPSPPSSSSQNIQLAYEALSAGRPEDAARLLAAVPQHGRATDTYWQVHAMLDRRRGNLEASHDSFQRALRFAPGNPAIHNSLGNLLDDMGRQEEALRAYRTALRLAPHYADARYNLGLLYRKVGRLAEAEEALDKVCREAPGNASAWLSLGLVRQARGELAAAAASLDRALALNPRSVAALRVRVAVERELGGSGEEYLKAARTLAPSSPELALDLAAFRAEDGALVEALRIVEQLATAYPESPDVQGALAKLRWQAGDEDGFMRSYDAQLRRSADPQFWGRYFTLLAQVGHYSRILDRLPEARDMLANPTAFMAFEAIAASETGADDAADRAFDVLAPLSTGLMVAKGRHLLRTSRFALAAEILEEASSSSPSSWPYLSLAWRLERDERSVWLDNLATIAVIDDPQLTALIPSLAPLIRGLHGRNAAPLDQTIRGGSQTIGKLLVRQDPAIVALRRRIEQLVTDYIEALPPFDVGHPFLGVPRNGFRIDGSWSVRLTSGGYHTDHIHPRGWISSALYLSVPDAADGDAGHLAFGQGPQELGLHLPPLKTVAPIPGRLVLFPSIMWHGTRPAPPGERMSIAFDVVSNSSTGAS